MKSKAFISHSSAQKKLVTEVAMELESQSIHFDEWTFEAGNKTWDEIIEALGDSGLFVLLTSKAAFKSQWVINEVHKAKELLDTGKLKGFLALNIDETLEVTSKTKEEFKDFPQWVFDEYNMRQITSPKVIALKIRSKINSILYELDTDYRRYRDVYFGRDEEKAAAKRRIADRSLSPLSCLVVSGFEGIGRKRFIQKVWEESAVTRPHQEMPLITMGENESIENFVMRIYSTGYTHLKEEDIYNLSSKTIDKKIEISVKALLNLGEWSKVLLIEDASSIINFDGVVAEWFDRILALLQQQKGKKPLIGLIAKSRVQVKYLSTHSNVFQVVLKPLSKKDCIALFNTLCDLENIHIDNVAHAESISETFNGEIEQIFYAVKYILNDSLAGLLRDIDSLKDFNLKRTANSLSRFEKDEDGSSKEVLKTLSRVNIFSLDLIDHVIVPVLGEEKTYKIISSFTNNHFIELLKVDSFIYQLNRAVRIYVASNKNWRENSEIASSLETYLRSLTERLVFLLENDFPLYELYIKESLSNKWSIDPRFILPSYQLDLIIQNYRQGRYDEVFEISEEVLSNAKHLDPSFLNKILNWYCKGLIRSKKDADFAEKIKLITDKSMRLLLYAFFHRFHQRYNKAIEYLKEAEEDRTKQGSLVYREFALCYGDIDDFRNAYKYAKKFYEASGFTTFSTNLYFKSLVRHKELDPNYMEVLKELLKELKQFDGSSGEHYLIALSQYYAFIEGNKIRAYETIDTAIRLHTEKVNHKRLNGYPYLDKMYYCVLFEDQSELEVTIKNFEAKFKGDGNWLYKPQFLKTKMRFYEMKGDFANADKFRSAYAEKSRGK